MVRDAGGELLRRAREAGAVHPGVSIDDLLALVSAISLAAEQDALDGAAEADRLLSLAVEGIGMHARPRPPDRAERPRRADPKAKPQVLIGSSAPPTSNPRLWVVARQTEPGGEPPADRAGVVGDVPGGPPEEPRGGPGPRAAGQGRGRRPNGLVDGPAPSAARSSRRLPSSAFRRTGRCHLGLRRLPRLPARRRAARPAPPPALGRAPPEPKAARPGQVLPTLSFASYHPKPEGLGFAKRVTFGEPEREPLTPEEVTALPGSGSARDDRHGGRFGKNGPA